MFAQTSIILAAFALASSAVAQTADNSQQYLPNIVKASNGTCSSTCQPFADNVSKCVADNGSNSAALAACSCMPMFLTNLYACGNCEDANSMPKNTYGNGNATGFLAQCTVVYPQLATTFVPPTAAAAPVSATPTNTNTVIVAPVNTGRPGYVNGANTLAAGSAAFVAAAFAVLAL